jgi:hypothetical protein
MAAVRSLRSLIARSRLLLVVALVAAVFAGMGFLDLAFTGQAYRGQLDAEQQRIDRLKEQNAVLQQELDRAQQNQHIPWRSWDYFGLVPKDVGVIEAPASAPEQLGPPVEDKPSLVERLYRLLR